MKDYSSEIKILRKIYYILQNMHEKQYLKDWNKYSINQKTFMAKINIITSKIIKLQWKLY